MNKTKRKILASLFPFVSTVYHIKPDSRVGLVIVDPGRGFTREGNLADPTNMVPMVNQITQLYRYLKEDLDERLHVLIFLDTHTADVPEPPYPPHCIVGTGEELIDPNLEFLLQEPRVTVIQKDCINGFVGAIDRESGSNHYSRWVIDNDIDTLLFCGDCTDICVSDLVCTSLSARNHGSFTATSRSWNTNYVQAITSMDLVVMTGECETFHAPNMGHEREAAHHVGLWMMSRRGAILAHDIL